jgi:alpha-D-xyloside xylohydrolase
MNEMPLRNEAGKLVRVHDAEILQIEAWGEHGLRVRATQRAEIDVRQDWALLPHAGAPAQVRIDGDEGTITNGELTARIGPGGRVTFRNARGEVVLDERWRVRKTPDTTFSSVEVKGREFRPGRGDTWRIAVRFEPRDGEKLYGMGQYQDGRLDLKGSVLELAQRNSQASVPYLVSSEGYGLLWNNPAIGRATLAANMTEFVADTTGQLDYWVTVGDTPARLVERYAAATGTVPMMPDFAMGFWQCKLRYGSQEELLSIAREYHRRGLPLSVVVADFFHWPTQGDWRFDPRYWPDPEGMIRELRELGVELAVSIWPTVDQRSASFAPMLENGFLVRTERGVRATMDFIGKTVYFDATHPGARAFVWDAARRNYYDKGVRLFWLDEAEPEYTPYDFENFRYNLGANVEVGNVYPLKYAQGFYEGLRAAGQEQVLSLLRCAWAGSQRYGALVWSGDIDTTWESFRAQLAAGLNMGLAGIPWWTTDIGGFEGGDPDSPAYRELLVRWFQWGAFCPVFRLHGYRRRRAADQSVVTARADTSEDVVSGGPNEVWSYGEQAYPILTRFLFLRERLRPYVKRLMEEAHARGTPVMRPLFYDFPRDPRAWTVADQYMFGPDVLVAPVMRPGVVTREVYLPQGNAWVEAATGRRHEGGRVVEAEAPLEIIPVFLREGVTLPIYTQG